MNAVLGKRNANRIANPVREQAANSYCTLNTAILAIAGLSYAKMNRVVPVGSLGGQARHQQPVSLDHHLGIAGLHRKNEIVIAEIAGDPGKLEGAFHHPEGRVAVAIHDAIAQASVVRADSHRDPMFLAELDERGKFFPNAGEFRVVLRVRVFAHSELLLVRVVAWIDAHLFHPLCRFHGRFRLEMDVCDQRDVAAPRAEGIRRYLKIGGIFDGRRGDSDDFTADRDEFQRWPTHFVGIHRVARQHRLDADRMGRRRAPPFRRALRGPRAANTCRDCRQ